MLSDLGGVCGAALWLTVTPPPFFRGLHFLLSLGASQKGQTEVPMSGRLLPRKLYTGLPHGHAQQRAGPALWTEVMSKKGTFHPL